MACHFIIVKQHGARRTRCGVPVARNSEAAESFLDVGHEAAIEVE
jgi:hypothetical protein